MTHRNGLLLLAPLRESSGVRISVRFACLSGLIIPEQQFGGARLGHLWCVIVSSDTTDWAVLFGIAVHTKQVISISIKAQKVTEECSLS